MSMLEDDPTRLPELFQTVNHLPEPRVLLGLTGAPGSGKSTLTDALVAEHRRRHPNEKIGVIAVDPSSPFSGGAVLGDRVRMMRHATDPNVYVRSLASRGHLGGLTLGVKGVARVMGLIGCQAVFIETVGVGQSEVEVAKVADLVAVILAPGQGDSIQMLKAGLMEIGDLFIINKADRDGASALQAQLLGALQLEHRAAGTQDDCGTHHGVTIENQQAEAFNDLALDAKPRVTVHLVSATNQTGIDELLNYVEQVAADNTDRWPKRREQRVADEVRDAILEEGRNRLAATLGHNGSLGSTVQAILEGKTNIRESVDELLKKTR